MVPRTSAARDLGAAQQDAIAVLIESEIVDDAHRGQRDAEFVAQLGPQCLNLLGELPRLVDERHQRRAEFEAQNVRPGAGAAIGRLGLRESGVLGGLVPAACARASRAPPSPAAIARNGRCGNPGNIPISPSSPPAPNSTPGLAHQLLADSVGQIEFARGARHDHARGGRGQQRRNLRRQSIADSQDGIGVERFDQARAHARSRRRRVPRPG